MSGIAAAAQSAGCCCRPAPNVGCSLQLLRPYVCAQADRWEELSVDVSGSVTYYAQDLPGQEAGVPCACYGGTVTASSTLGRFFVSKSTGPSFPGPCLFSWSLRSNPVIGSLSTLPNQCYADVTCCRFTDWWPPCNQQICVDMGVPDGIRPPRSVPYCTTSQGATTVCGNCPTGAQPYLFTNYHPVPSGDVVLILGRIGIESGFTIEPCGIPAAGTPVRFVLSIQAWGYRTCQGVTSAGPGGFMVRYVKPCCNYLDGPVGVYYLEGTYGTTTTSTSCWIEQTTAQFSPTATVREVPS